MVLSTANPDVGRKSDFLARVDRDNHALMNTRTRLAPGCKIKALVVDDHPINREMLIRTLTMLGVELDTAVSGLEAVEKVRTWLPDIIFMDMRMMVTDGKEALLAIQKEFDRIKIAILTASGLDYRREEYIKAGCHYLISKPFHIESIHECLGRLVGAEFEYKEVAQTAQAS